MLRKLDLPTSDNEHNDGDDNNDDDDDDDDDKRRMSNCPVRNDSVWQLPRSFSNQHDIRILYLKMYKNVPYFLLL